MAVAANLLLVLAAVCAALDFTKAAEEFYDAIYPGQVHLGLLAPVCRRLSYSNGYLSVDAARSVLSGIWAIRHLNSLKEARELNLGLVVYDTCQKEDLGQKQISRLIEHFSLRRCRNDSRPPIAGIIVFGNSGISDMPARILSAFAVPTITTSFIRSTPKLSRTSSAFSTSPSFLLLSQAVVALANFSNWTRIMVIDLFGTLAVNVFRELASKENIKVFSLHEVDVKDRSMQAVAVFEDDNEDFLEVLSTIKILHGFKDTPEIPIVLVSTHSDHMELRMNKVSYQSMIFISVSPESLTIPSFEEFWNEELSRVNSSEHPFVRQLTNSNDTATYARLMNTSTDISSTVKAVWAFAEALKSIQNRVCSHGNDCMSLIRQTLESDLVLQLRASNFTINDVFEERNASFRFDQAHNMFGGRITFRLRRNFVYEQFGWYGDDGVTNVPVLNITSTDYLFPPTTTSKLKGPRSSSLLSPPAREVTSASVTWRNYSNHSAESGSDGVYNVPTSGGNYNLAAWVSRPWCLAVIILSTVGILSCIYITSFLLMKSCEGSLKKRNQPLLFLTLVAMSVTLGSAIPYVFRPTSLLCRVCRVCHNLSLTFLSGSLLLQGLHLRSQELLGLGGRVSRFNQMITLWFILGVQIAIETQQWVFRQSDFEYLNGVPSCASTTFDFGTSQIYIGYLVLLGVIISYSSRNVPYNHREGQCLWLTQVSFLVAFAAKFVLYCVLDVADAKNLTRSVGIIVLSYIVLAGIYIPYLYDVHSQGGLPHKPLSYAESMSTVFTMFKQDGDSVSGESTTSRGRKGAKTLERTDGMVEMTHNPLYDDFRSVYA